MLWIGLTGGIATGKSSVARILLDKGLDIIDADQISRELTGLGGAAIEGIRLAFGPEFIDENGALDRAKMAKLIFADSQQRKKLESILHPIIQRKVLEKKSNLERQGRQIAFYDVPLLFENKLNSHFDFIWVVSCRPELQIERLMKRDGLTKEQALGRVASQMPLNEKEKMATRIIWNNDGMDYLKKEVEAALKSIQT